MYYKLASWYAHTHTHTHLLPFKPLALHENEKKQTWFSELFPSLLLKTISFPPIFNKETWLIIFTLMFIFFRLQFYSKKGSSSQAKSVTRSKATSSFIGCCLLMLVYCCVEMETITLARIAHCVKEENCHVLFELHFRTISLFNMILL